MVDDADPNVGELATIADQRARRGVRHSITMIVAVAMAATVAGVRAFTLLPGALPTLRPPNEPGSGSARQ